MINGNSARTRNPDLPITASKPLHPHGIYFRVQTAPLEKPACICLCKRNTVFLDSTSAEFPPRLAHCPRRAGVKTITSPWILYSGCRRLRSKNLLALLSHRDTVFLDFTSRTSVRSACPLPSPGWRQNHYIPMDFVFRMKTAPLESSPEFVNSLTLINKFCPLRIPFHFPERR